MPCAYSEYIGHAQCNRGKTPTHIHDTRHTTHTCFVFILVSRQVSSHCEEIKASINHPFKHGLPHVNTHTHTPTVHQRTDPPPCCPCGHERFLWPTCPHVKHLRGPEARPLPPLPYFRLAQCSSCGWPVLRLFLPWPSPGLLHNKSHTFISLNNTGYSIVFFYNIRMEETRGK